MCIRDSLGDGLTNEDDPRRLRAVQVAVIAQRTRQEGVAVTVHFQDGAHHATDGLHLVTDIEP